MATADLSFEMKIKGTPEEVASILDVMLEYNEGKNGTYFSCISITVCDKCFSLGLTSKDELTAAINSNSGTAAISALGPFGKYGEIDEVDILRDMAQAAPNAHFTASIDGFAGYADQNLSAELANGRLHVSTFYLSDDCRADGELEYLKTHLPYDRFIELFSLDSEEFDEEQYEDFFSDNLCCFESIGEFFEETEYEEFVEMLDVECPLSEDEYGEIVQQLLEEDFEYCNDYLEREGFAQREEYTYDPVENKYLDSDRPKLKSGVAYSVNDEIREYLDSIGQPSDDEAIGALSVEDVYAILAGTYGKDICAEDANSDIEDSDEDIDDEDIDDEDANDEDSDDEDSDDEDSDDEESDDEDSDDEESDDEDSDDEKIDDESPNNAPSDAVTADNAEAESNPPAKKKTCRPWLVALIIVIILLCIAAVAFFFGEEIFAYASKLLGIAARLL